MSSPFHRTIVLLVASIAGLTLGASPAAAGGRADPVADPLGGVQEQGRNVVVQVRAGASEIVQVGVGGVIRQGGENLPFRRTSATVAPGNKAALELRLKRDLHERRVVAALREGKTLTATVTFRFEDLLGNVGKRTKTIKLT
jgi:hypothetical protein